MRCDWGRSGAGSIVRWMGMVEKAANMKPTATGEQRTEQVQGRGGHVREVHRSRSSWLGVGT